MKHLDRTLVLLVLFLLGLGLVQVYSASFIFATESYNNGLYFFLRQLLFIFLGILILFSAALVPWSWWSRYGWLLWIAATIGVAMTLVPGMGHRVGGASRWIAMPFGFRVEPSEFLKLGAPLFLAALLRREGALAPLVASEPAKWKWRTLFELSLLGLPLTILLKQPDFGSFALISLTLLLTLFAFGLRWRWILLMVFSALPTFYYFVYQVPYRWKRIEAFLDPWSDPANKGFQVIQSMTSLANGGWNGVGLGQGQGKLFFLPEAHTDFTFAILGEELGFLGVILVLFIFGLSLFRCFRISFSCEDRYSQAASLGLTVLIFLSIFTNIAVAMGILPTKGLTLPFLSYGGSSLLASCLAFGILLNIGRQQRLRQERMSTFISLKN